MVFWSNMVAPVFQQNQICRFVVCWSFSKPVPNHHYNLLCVKYQQKDRWRYIMQAVCKFIFLCLLFMLYYNNFDCPFAHFIGRPIASYFHSYHKLVLWQLVKRFASDLQVCQITVLKISLKLVKVNSCFWFMFSWDILVLQNLRHKEKILTAVINCFVVVVVGWLLFF